MLYLSHPFTFNLPIPLYLKWVSCRQHVVESCFVIYYNILFLLIYIFRLLKFYVIIDIFGLGIPLYYVFSMLFVHDLFPVLLSFGLFKYVLVFHLNLSIEFLTIYFVQFC